MSVGLIINNELNWKRHLDLLTNSLHSRLFLLRKLSRNIPPRCLISILEGFFLSRIRYGLAVYGQPSPLSDSTQLKRLQTLMNAAMRIATGTRISDKIRISKLLEETKLTNVNQSCLLAITLTTRSIIEHNIIPELKSALTKARVENRQITTRSQTRKDLVPQPSKFVRCRSFSYFAAQLWNQLPTQLRNGHLSNPTFKKEAQAFIKKLII